MDPAVSGLALVGFLIVTLGSGVWIFAGLLVVSFLGLYFLVDMPLSRVLSVAGSITYRSASTWELAAVPLFIWVAELIFRSTVSERLFRGLAPFVDRVPGRLLHTNVLGCTLFAAVSGSSAATTATVGKITSSELVTRGYDARLAVGSLAGAGSLGLLLPPSIAMIIYGILAEVSVSRLFAAGVLPGLMVAGLYSGFIMLMALVKPSIAPAGHETYRLRDYLRGLVDLAPVITLMGIVLGAIYSGIATPSEAAAVGVFAAFVVLGLMRELSWDLLRDSLMGTVRTSVMVCIILVSASLLSTTLGYLHLPQELGAAIAGMGLDPLTLIALLALFYLVLGVFVDGVAIIVMTLPMTLPLIVAAGYDPVWFGVFLILMVEIGLLTPPVGINLFVLQGLTGWTLGRVSRAAVPFFLLFGLAVAILVAFPQIALWLPGLLYD
ncbi:TRAP transporter large permease subunit [Citreicella sp. C3M06]|uniref:TRAP transporter large permease n=1 Tax=Citreicella sp. C3M06 TaxID=2841564 RepID=UPI001C08182A|nr:TRAP transporter large permease subunit [Citreicella sp. C3M06]MBU2963539.1 TRAP transporter large permease subunit [Citreicella sp. C3M06]